MTRPVFILATTVCIFLFSACTDSKVNSEIERLSAHKVEMEQQINSLQRQLDSLKNENRQLNDKLAELDFFN